MCRALRAQRVVEAGTSFGVSTLFLAAAVRDNLPNGAEVQLHGGARPIVIGTEREPEKARIARGHFAEAGLSDLIELREGDLRETLVDVQGPVDFMLIDIWTPMARPALARVAPRSARRGSGDLRQHGAVSRRLRRVLRIRARSAQRATHHDIALRRRARVHSSCSLNAPALLRSVAMANQISSVRIAPRTERGAARSCSTSRRPASRCCFAPRPAGMSPGRCSGERRPTAETSGF